MTYQEATAQSTHCFYVNGARTIIDMARPDGRSVIYGHTLEEVRERHPGAEIVPFDDAVEVIRKLDHDHYKVGEAQEITAERFEEMLCVLPPDRWTRRNGSESFQMCERLCGTITGCYVRIGDKFYQVNHHHGTSHEKLVECCERLKAA